MIILNPNKLINPNQPADNLLEASREERFRQIFDRLAHSSIMRLNETSMDKLFDLMAQGGSREFCFSAQADHL